MIKVEIEDIGNFIRIIRKAIKKGMSDDDILNCLFKSLLK